jgi:hypothetical protein
MRRSTYGFCHGESRRGNDFFDAHRVNSIAEVLTIGCVTVPQQIARRRVPRKGLGHLARASLRRVLGDTEVNDPPSIMTEDDPGAEEPKCHRRDDEHVDRDNVGHVVLQKGAPGRGGDFWGATACVSRPL